MIKILKENSNMLDSSICSDLESDAEADDIENSKIA